jgi:D-tyrosyl-tRNA(Tyr) deacylase
VRAVVQRVHSAQVVVADEVVGAIGPGLLVFVGVGANDTDADLEYVASKVESLRIFEDDDGRMNRSIADTGGALLIVSQFTLYGDVRKGRRPSFTASMAPAEAEVMFERLLARLRKNTANVQTGRFGADMDVSLVNHGPVTIILDSTRIL